MGNKAITFLEDMYAKGTCQLQNPCLQRKYIYSRGGKMLGIFWNLSFQKIDICINEEKIAFLLIYIF